MKKPVVQVCLIYDFPQTIDNIVSSFAVRLINSIT